MDQYNIQAHHHLNSIQVNQYILEFHSGLSNRLDLFLSQYGSNMIYGQVNLSSVIRLHMENYLANEAEYYVLSRSSGLSSSMSFHRIDQIIQLFCVKCTDGDNLIKSSNSLWENQLKSLAGCVLVFSVDSYRILEDCRYLFDINSQVLVVTIDDFPETDVEYPDDFSALQLPYTDVLHCDNSYLRRYFPFIHKVANSVLWLVSILRPSDIILYETKSFECMIIRCASESYKIPLTIR